MIGQVVPSLAVNTPDGYIEVNGQTITRATYPKFFEVMGIEGDTYTLPSLNEHYITLGHAGHSTFSFRAHEDGVNGTLALYTIQAHQHSAPETFNLRPLVNQQGYIGYKGAHNGGSYGPSYSTTSTTSRIMSIKVEDAGSLSVVDRNIIVRYLIGVE